MPEEAIKNEGEIENVRVVVRVRPMDKNELDSSCQNVIKVDKSNRSITVVKPTANSSEPPKVYYFDNVFGEDSTQEFAKPLMVKCRRMQIQYPGVSGGCINHFFSISTYRISYARVDNLKRMYGFDRLMLF